MLDGGSSPALSPLGPEPLGWTTPSPGTPYGRQTPLRPNKHVGGSRMWLPWLVGDV